MRAILLNDAGARLIEATADVALSSISLLEQTPELWSLCMSDNNAEELMVVQITRFACGSFAVSNTMQHLVADAYGICKFFIASGMASRGITIDHIPVYDRASIFMPRNPPRVEYDHKGTEFWPRHHERVCNNLVDPSGEVVEHRMHFTPEMLSKLKSQGSAGAPRPYSTLLCVAAHLWRCITKARGLDGDKTTKLIIPVNGRQHMLPPLVLEEYIGNVVLWAQPTITVKELLAKPLPHIVELISREVARINDDYFRSFIDFASSGVVEEEGLVPMAAMAETMDHSTSVFVSNMKGIQIMYDLDFGTGRPFLFTRSYRPEDGFVFIIPPFSNDGSMNVQVGLFSRSMDIFMDCCYSLVTANSRLFKEGGSDDVQGMQFG